MRGRFREGSTQQLDNKPDSATMHIPKWKSARRVNQGVAVNLMSDHGNVAESMRSRQG